MENMGSLALTGQKCSGLMSSDQYVSGFLEKLHACEVWVPHLSASADLYRVMGELGRAAGVVGAARLGPTGDLYPT